MELPKRKSIRLKGYDYSQDGAYFVTFCVKDRHELLGKVVVGSGFHARPLVELSDLGKEVQKSIEYINSNDKTADIQKYTIMPNHVHLIVSLLAIGDGRGCAVGDGTPTLQSVIGRIKSFTAGRWNAMENTDNLTFWQRFFHDHIIRNEEDYQRIWQYIDENPARWIEDCYYG